MSLIGQPAASATNPERSHATFAAGEAFKTNGTDWWTPPDQTLLYAPIPYVAPLVEDALSSNEKLVLRSVTNVKLGAKKQTGADGTERGYLCDPGGYNRIAKAVGVCTKTVYNTIKSLIKKGALRVFEIKTQGGQRVKTLYFAPHYGDVLDHWRGDDNLFKTARGAVVVRGRAKAIMTVGEARDWRIDPKRAPKRGCGRGRNPGEDDQEQLFEEQRETQTAALPAMTKAVPPPIPARVAPACSDEDLALVLDGFQKVSRACLQDAIDLVAAARKEQERCPFAITAVDIVAALEEVAAGHTASVKYALPTPKWLIDRIGGTLAHRMKVLRTQFRNVPLERLSRESRVDWLKTAIEIQASGRASPDEAKFCSQWIGYFEESAPDELAEAKALLAPEQRSKAG